MAISYKISELFNKPFSIRCIHLVASLIIVSSFYACSKDNEAAQKEDGEKYVTISIDALRSHGADSDNPSVTDPNTDTELNEDKIDDIRIIFIPQGEERAIFNQKFYLNSVVQDRSQIKAKLETKIKNCDMFVIANDEANGKIDFLSNPNVTRTQLTQAYAALAQNIVPETIGAGANKLFMMTAYYTDITIGPNLSGNGTKINPYQLDLTRQNEDQRPNLQGIDGDRSGIELWRAMAKIEIILKDVVEVNYNTDKPSYNWVFPYGIKENQVKIALINIPLKFTIFPSNSYTAPQKADIHKSYQWFITINDRLARKPKPEYIIYPDKKDAPIGGILTADYKIFFYVPEYLLNKNKMNDESTKPSLMITRKLMNNRYDMNLFPLQNPTNNGGFIHYRYMIPSLTTLDGSSIYRNRNYRINITFMPTGPIVWQ